MLSRMEESARLGFSRKNAKANINGSINADTTPQKVDPILSIRSMFSLGRNSRNSNKGDPSNVVLPGRRDSTFFLPTDHESDGGGSRKSKFITRHKHRIHRTELEGLSDLDDSVCTPSGTTASMSQYTRQHSTSEGSVHGNRRRRFSRGTNSSRNGKSKSKTTNVVHATSESESNLCPPNKSDEISSIAGEEGEKVLLTNKLEQQQPPGRIHVSTKSRKRLGKRRSSLFAVDERRASVDLTDLNGGGTAPTRSVAAAAAACGSGTGGDSSSCEDSIAKEVAMHGRSSFGNDGTSLICKFPSRNSSPGYSADDDTLICSWGRRQSNVSSVSSIDSRVSNTEELLLRAKDVVSGSLICGWDESQVSILSESSASLDEKLLRDIAESCTLFDVHRPGEGSRKIK